MRHVPLILTVALALPALLAGCTTTDNGNGDGDADESGIPVEMKNSRFVPQTLEVEVGDKVTWTNLDSVGHTVTPFDSDVWGTEGSGSAREDLMGRGDTYSFTFTEAGTYEYRCIPHSGPDGDGYVGMIGTVIVGAAEADTTDGNQAGDGNDTM